MSLPIVLMFALLVAQFFFQDNLAVTLMALQRLDEAEPLLKEAVEGRWRVVPRWRPTAGWVFPFETIHFGGFPPIFGNTRMDNLPR